MTALKDHNQTHFACDLHSVVQRSHWKASESVKRQPILNSNLRRPPIIKWRNHLNFPHESAVFKILLKVANSYLIRLISSPPRHLRHSYLDQAQLSHSYSSTRSLGYNYPQFFAAFSQ